MKTRSPIPSSPRSGPARHGGRADGLRRYLRFPRSLSVTREGKVFIGVLLVIGLAAVNTGNNLLYLVVAAMLSVIIVSGLMSETTLRGLRLRRSLPPFAYKGSPAYITLCVENRKRLFSSYSFSAGGGHSRLSSQPYLVRLGPGESRELRIEYLFTERGLANLGPMRVSTRFPFGLFVKGKEEAGRQELLVLPSIDRGLAMDASAGASSAPSESHRALRGSGDEFHGLREYGLTDDARHIHWKSAARKEQLLIKEFEGEAGKAVTIVFENRRGGTGAEFEELVDRAAATAAFHIWKGRPVGLKTLGKSVPPRPGSPHLFELLSVLALVTPEHADGPPSLRVVSS